MKIRRWLMGGLFMLGLSLAIWLALGILAANRRLPEAVLRELDLLTPAGSTVAEVELAIREGRLQQGMCWEEDKDGGKSLISVRFAVAAHKDRRMYFRILHVVPTPAHRFFNRRTEAAASCVNRTRGSP
jgi:hypothetical protein